MRQKYVPIIPAGGAVINTVKKFSCKCTNALPQTRRKKNSGLPDISRKTAVCIFCFKTAVSVLILTGSISRCACTAAE